MEGLGSLNISTTFYSEKVTTQVEAEVAGTGPLLEGMKGCRVAGYEIHMGKTRLEAGVYPAFIITESSGRKAHSPDGAVSRDGLVFGTYIHGIFDSSEFRRCVLNNLRARKGLRPLAPATSVPAFEQRQ
jgi:adenosylcobyric acid synthase